MRDKERKITRLNNAVVVVAAASFANRLKEDHEARRQERRDKGESSDSSASEFGSTRVKKVKGDSLQVTQPQKIAELDEPEASPTAVVRKGRRNVRLPGQDKPASDKKEECIKLSNPEEESEIRLVLKSNHENLVISCEEDSEYEIVIRCRRKIKAHVL